MGVGCLQAGAQAPGRRRVGVGAQISNKHAAQLLIKQPNWLAGKCASAGQGFWSQQLSACRRRYGLCACSIAGGGHVQGSAWLRHQWLAPSQPDRPHPWHGAPFCATSRDRRSRAARLLPQGPSMALLDSLPSGSSGHEHLTPTTSATRAQ